MLSLDGEWSNLPHLVCILLTKLFFLFLGVLAKKMRRSLVFNVEKEAMGTYFEEEKRSYMKLQD